MWSRIIINFKLGIYPIFGIMGFTVRYLDEVMNQKLLKSGQMNNNNNNNNNNNERIKIKDTDAQC